MKEMMPSFRKIEQTTDSKTNPALEKIGAILMRAQEYVKTMQLTRLGKIGVITFLLTAGTLEATAGQASPYPLDNAITSIDSGTADLDTTVRNIADAYRVTHNFSGSSTIQISQSFEKGALGGGNVVTAGEIIPIGNVGDTVAIGDADVQSFSVMGTQNNETPDTGGQLSPTTTQYSNTFASIKTNPASLDTAHQEKFSETCLGKTPQEAALAALLIASGNQSSLIHSASTSTVGNESSSNATAKSSSKFTNLSTLETNNVLRNTEVIISEVPGGYSAEVIYQ